MTSTQLRGLLRISSSSSQLETAIVTYSGSALASVSEIDRRVSALGSIKPTDRSCDPGLARLGKLIPDSWAMPLRSPTAGRLRINSELPLPRIAHALRECGNLQDFERTERPATRLPT